MRYKALLFCPDEKAARLLTQALNEVDFSIELSSEPFSTVKRLTDEHFHALVVDCENEQNASLLFKGARNSTLNHGSLYVAVVEGQTGVAKAFRIGANLVLTKPINVQQSKSTLRVARGLLRKNDPKPAPRPAGAEAASQMPKTMTVAGAPSAAPEAAPVPAAWPGADANPAATPFSMIEVEREPHPEPEAADVALLESIPDPVRAKPAPVEPTLPHPGARAAPVAVMSARPSAAAAQPVLEKPLREAKPATSDLTPAGERATAALVDIAAPTPSSPAEDSRSSGGVKKLLRLVCLAVILGRLGYAVWQNRVTLGATLSRLRSITVRRASAPQSHSLGASPLLGAAQDEKQAPLEPTPPLPSVTPGPSAGSSAVPSDAIGPQAQHSAAAESIEVKELAEPSPQAKLTVAPKPQPLAVRPDTRVATKSEETEPPALPLAGASAPDRALSGIVAANAAPAPVLRGALRISQGVSQGLLVKKVAPVYPAVALRLRKQGAVELLATISKSGSISNLKVLGGDPALAESAVRAVRQWKYRPYLLNSEPVELETQITVNFRLPN